MKRFVFLYPISEYIDFEISNHSWSYNGSEEFKDFYSKMLNSCIDLRYRQNEFEIVYIVFRHHEMSPILRKRHGDRIIETEVNYSDFIIPDDKGNHPYPCIEKLLEVIGNSEKLVISGFHMWDCVERLAKTAYEKDIDVLVDEDLTEFFCYNIRYPDFRTNIYPGRIKKEMNKRLFEEFSDARINKPWLLQY